MRDDQNSRRSPAMSPAVEGLEGRALLSTYGSTSALIARAQHKYHQFVSDLQRVELRSTATPAEALALRDDARAISADAASTTLPPAIARQKAVAATYILDRAPLDGGLGDAGFAGIRERLAAALDGLNVPTALLDDTVASIRAIADSAGVTAAEHDDLLDKTASYTRARNALPNGTITLPDPSTYYTQHLRGFFRGGAAARRLDGEALEAEIRTAAGGDPSRAATLRRDALGFVQIGATTTSGVARSLAAALGPAHDPGPPTAQAVADLKASARAILGPGASALTLGRVDRLADDSPALFQAAGSSSVAARAVVDAALKVVLDGGGSLPNSLRITGG